jgi:choice-of-anchor A domain-containing protein
MKISLLFLLGLLIGSSLQQTTPPTVAGPTVATAAPLPTGQQQQCPFPPVFGSVPSLFNVFVFQDVTLLDSEVGGRLAAGGNAALTNVNVGAQLPLLVCPATAGGTQPQGTQGQGTQGQGTQPQGTVVGIPGTVATEGGFKRQIGTVPAGTTPAGTAPAGTAGATQQEWFDTVVVGNNLSWNTGSLATGNAVAGSSQNVSQDVLQGLQAPCGVRQEPNRVDFQNWQIYLNDLSSRLASIGATSTASLQNGALIIPAPQSGNEGGFARRQAEVDEVVAVEVQAADLLQATEVTIQEQGAQATTPVPAPGTQGQPTQGGWQARQVATVAPPGTIPAGTVPAGTAPTGTQGQEQGGRVWIFSVFGSPCGFGSTQWQELQQQSSKIIWNFVNCTSLSIGGAAAGTAATTPETATAAAPGTAVIPGTGGEVSGGIPGSILAPMAAVTIQNTNINGQLFAMSLNGNGNFNNTLFDGCFEVPPQQQGTQGTQGGAGGAGTQVGTQVEQTAIGTTPAGTAFAPTVAKAEQNPNSDGTKVTVSALVTLLAMFALW